jgi:hypothetical protein
MVLTSGIVKETLASSVFQDLYQIDTENKGKGRGHKRRFHSRRVRYK